MNASTIPAPNERAVDALVDINRAAHAARAIAKAHAWFIVEDDSGHAVPGTHTIEEGLLAGIEMLSELISERAIQVGDMLGADVDERSGAFFFGAKTDPT